MKKLPKPNGTILRKTRQDIYPVIIKDYTGLRWLKEVRKLE
jgi:hypothetical protein